MTRSRYFGIPLLAAFSVAVSLALLPLQPAGANANDLKAAQSGDIASATTANKS
jgi:hypothetical protein